MKLVEVEYTKDVQRYSGHERDVDGNDAASTIAKGSRFKVDERSAASLVKKQVARIITDADRKKEAAAAAKAAKNEASGGDAPAGGDQ